jgi:hypothetical protein
MEVRSVARPTTTESFYSLQGTLKGTRVGL